MEPTHPKLSASPYTYWSTLSYCFSPFLLILLRSFHFLSENKAVKPKLLEAINHDTVDAAIALKLFGYRTV